VDIEKGFDDGNCEYFHVAPFTFLPSYCPFVEYEMELDDITFNFEILSAKFVRPGKKEVAQTTLSFGRSPNNEKWILRTLRGNNHLSRDWIEGDCEDWAVREILTDAGFEKEFYELLPHFAADFLKILDEEQRGFLARLLYGFPEAFQYWSRLVNAAPFPLMIPDPREFWRKPPYVGPYQPERPDLSIRNITEFSLGARTLIDNFYTSYYRTGIPQIKCNGEEQTLIDTGIFIRDPVSNLLLLPEIEEAELGLIDNLLKCETLRLISCPARDDHFLIHFEKLCGEFESPKLLAANRTWANELTSLTGSKVLALDDYSADTPAGNVAIVDMTHRARTQDLAKLRFSTLILIGDLNDCTAHYWRGGGRVFHDLYDWRCSIERWDSTEWVLSPYHTAMLTRSIHSYPKKIVLSTNKDCASNSKRFAKMRRADASRCVRFCSSEYDRDIVLQDLAPQTLNVGKGTYIHVLDTDEKDHITSMIHNGSQLLRKKDKLEKGRDNAKLCLAEGSTVDLRVETIDTTDICIASRYPGPIMDIGIFYVGKHTKLEEILGIMKFCRERIELAILPDADISKVYASHPPITSFSLKLRGHPFY
jgi:hypothetical protein